MKYLVIFLVCFAYAYALPNGQPANNTDDERGLHVRKNVTHEHNGKNGVDVLCFCHTRDTELHGSFNGIKCTCSNSIEEILDNDPDERALSRPDPFSQKVAQDKVTVKALNYVLFGPEIKPILDNFTYNHSSAQVDASAGGDERGIHVKKNISHHFNASSDIFCFCHVGDTALQGSFNDFDCSCTPTVAEIIAAYDLEPTERGFGKTLSNKVNSAVNSAKKNLSKGNLEKAAAISGAIAGVAGLATLSGVAAPVAGPIAAVAGCAAAVLTCAATFRKDKKGKGK